MSRTPKNKKNRFRYETDASKKHQLSQCSLCGKQFKSYSHFDAICNLCWADNEMRPYLATKGFGGAGMVN